MVLATLITYMYTGVCECVRQLYFQIINFYQLHIYTIYSLRFRLVIILAFNFCCQNSCHSHIYFFLSKY